MASSGEPSGTEIPTDIARLPVGAALRTRREQLGWSMQEVAAWLRIRLPYLEALESGQVGTLPGTAYAMGFLRAYATALGLDADDMIRRFRGETKDVVRKPELSFPVPVPERGVPAGAIVLLGVVMVVAAYVGWYEMGGRLLTHQTHTVPPVPDALAPYAGGTRSGPSPQVATVMPGPGQTPSPVSPAGTDNKPSEAPVQKPANASPETAGVAADMPQPTVVPVPAPAGGAAPATAPATATAPVPAPAAGSAASPPFVTAATGTGGAATQGPTSSGPAAVAAAATTAVTLNAVTSSWVQVRQVGGKVIYDHVLQAGEHWSVPPDSGDVVLSTGNAGGVTVSADGVTSPVLGRVGGVRRGIPLTAEAVKTGSIAASESGDALSRGSAGVTTTRPSAAPAAPSSATPVPDAGPVATPPAATTPAAGPAGSADPIRPVARPHPVVHRAAPEASQGEDETERLNRAQLKQSSPHP